MNAEKFENLLIELGACEEARKWAKGKSLAVVYRTCKRGDWLLWLFGDMADKPGWPTRKQVVLAACDCAETALKYVTKGEDRPKRAIETARKWAGGKATIEEVRDAANAAYAAASAAANAANAAAYNAYDAAAYASAAAYDAASAAKTSAKLATIVRCTLKLPKVK